MLITDPLTTEPGAWRGVHESLMRTRRSLLRRLQPMERDALACYANLDSGRAGCGFEMNRELRSSGRGNRLLMERIAGMDGVFAKANRTLPDPIRYLYRGEMMSTKRIPTVGSMYADPAYLSTSPLLARALMYAGTPTPAILMYDLAGDTRWVYSPNEEEVILCRGIRWRVERVLRNVKVDPRMSRHPRDPETDLCAIIPSHITVIVVARVPNE